MRSVYKNKVHLCLERIGREPEEAAQSMRLILQSTEEYPEEERLLSLKRGQGPGFSLTWELLSKELHEDLAEVKGKYQINIRWVEPIVATERMPILQIYLKAEHPFQKALDALSGELKIPADPIDAGAPIVRLHTKSPAESEKKALVAASFHPQYSGYLSMTLEDIVCERLSAYWRKTIQQLEEATDISRMERTIYEAVGEDEFLRFLTIRDGLFGSQKGKKQWYTSCIAKWDKEWANSIYNAEYVESLAALLPMAKEQLKLVEKR